MRKPLVEIHVKGYGKIKGTERIIGLTTRLLIHMPKGNTEIFNFDYNYQARKYLEDRFGKLEEKNYEVVSNWAKYGKAGFKW